uniref:OJ000315_02.7 protein n=2 Tax=Oryza sativa subsp. japonica TaxID=39947 RepID=Q7X7G9_ORYSJ|nr:OJ000315_02.7 [Oryza sativa Japonica Group]
MSTSHLSSSLSLLSLLPSPSLSLLPGLPTTRVVGGAGELRWRRRAWSAPPLDRSTLEAEKVSREEQLEIASGAGHGWRGRLSMLRYCSEVRPRRKSGGREVKALPSRARRVREAIPAREGTAPASAFPWSCSAVSEVREESVGGSVPASTLLARLSSVTFPDPPRSQVTASKPHTLSPSHPRAGTDLARSWMASASEANSATSAAAMMRRRTLGACFLRLRMASWKVPYMSAKTKKPSRREEAVDELVVWATRFFGRRSRLASAAWSAWRWARPAGRYGRVGEPEENCCDDGMEVGEQRVGATKEVVRVAKELRGSDRAAADEVAEEEARVVC